MYLTDVIASQVFFSLALLLTVNVSICRIVNLVGRGHF